MSNSSNFIRPMLPGERRGQAVRKTSREDAKNANIGGASVLPLNAIVDFDFDDEVPIYDQDRQNSTDKNYYVGAHVNGKDRCILTGTFYRTDFNGDGEPISQDVTAWARQFDNVEALANALKGKKFKVAATKKCQTSVWVGGEATDRMRTTNYPVLEFVND
jgi:hypothetical protein